MTTRASLVELQDLGEALLVIVATWLALGWFFDRAITQSDGTVFVVPYARSALAGGFDWTHHLYRFGVVGGSAMHDFNGTLPLTQLCALVGLSTTATVNATTIFVQLCFGFFGLVAVRALVATWSGPALVLPQRIACVWLTGFAPVLEWRLGYGHEILLLGLVPLVAGLALLWASRANTLGITALVVAAFAVWNAVSCLGQQTLIYSVVFAGPIAIVAIVDAPKGRRVGPAQWGIACALAAGVLLALPRLVGMIQYATGDDASRSLSGSLVYAYPSPSAGDWLASLTWSGHLDGVEPLHERNFPLGPIAILAIAMWPHGVSRRLLWALGAGLVLALLFAGDVPPVSTLLAHAPLVEAFRVPARAVLPVLVIVPILAVAAWAARPASPIPSRAWWLAILVAIAVIVVGGSLPVVVRELVAWLACLAIAAAACWRPEHYARRHLALGMLLVAALGVVAFGERIPRDPRFDPVENGPAEVRTAVLAQAPELAMALNRVQIVDAPPPYEMSTAFAAGLASLDGDMIPPRRFFALVSALGGRPVPPTTVVWKLTRSRAFPVLQQLYNVMYAVQLPTSITALPATPGPAWFPDQTAGVRAVTTDDLGQTATIAADVPAGGCVLVVATNYVGTLRASAGDASLPVFPIDVALTGIAVPGDV